MGNPWRMTRTRDGGSVLDRTRSNSRISSSSASTTSRWAAGNHTLDCGGPFEAEAGCMIRRIRAKLSSPCVTNFLRGMSSLPLLSICSPILGSIIMSPRRCFIVCPLFRKKGIVVLVFVSVLRFLHLNIILILSPPDFRDRRENHCRSPAHVHLSGPRPKSIDSGSSVRLVTLLPTHKPTVAGVPPAHTVVTKRQIAHSRLASRC